VGDGTKIRIKYNNWLPEAGHRQIPSHVPDLPLDAKVSTLMCGTPPSWNVDLIWQIFLPYDAEAILHIPLSERAPVDKGYWHEAKDGKYSVWSRYRLLMTKTWNTRPTSSNALEPDGLWKSVWNLHVLTKIKNFLWHSCHDSLPTKAALYRRNVVPDPKYDACNTFEEDSLRALWSYPGLSIVWQTSPELSSFCQKQ
jgi:hypothetical protein